MRIEEFVAKRRARVTRADADLLPGVTDGLEKLVDGESNWADDIIADAAILWLEVYDEESPGGGRGIALARFRREVTKSLKETATPTEGGFDASAQRVTNWLSTYTVNNATMAGALKRGVRFKRWTDMGDGHVREMHEATDGQIVPIGGTFDVGGHKLAFPGEPIGPPEVWIQCRCLAMPAARDGETMSGTTYTIGPEDDVLENPDVVEGYDVVLAAAVVDEEDIAVEPADEEDLPDEDLIPDEPEDGEELITEIPVHGVLAPEGVATGDGRKFAIGALSVRDLPLPLRYEIIGSHGGDTSHVVTVGRIDNAWRDDATDSWRYTGAIVLTKPHAQEVIDGLVDGTVRGISIDGDDAEVEVTPVGEGDDPMDALLDMMGSNETVFSKMRVAGATIVPIPAFQEAYTALGHEFQEDLTDEDRVVQAAALATCGCAAGVEHEASALESENLLHAMLGRAGAFAPGTHDGPGWITHPVATARIRRYWVSGKGAAKIKWGAPGDFNRCRTQLAKYVQNPDWLAGLCANMHHEALGIWPAQHAGKMSAAVIAAAGAPIARLVEPEYEVYPHSWFSDPGLDRAVPLRIDKDTRRVYGYVAEWGTCHVGMQGFCQDVPRSYSNYSYFLKGLVDTDEGEQSVGCLTFGGHASETMRLSAAAAYYDKPDAVRAFVNVGEDEFGIWFAGIIPPDVSDHDIDKMRAIGAVSGDWREVRGKLELIGVPVVNAPGFPLKRLAASAGKQISLIGAGALPPEPQKTATFTMTLSPETVAAIARTAVDEYRHREKVEAALQPARAKVRARTLAVARARIERG